MGSSSKRTRFVGPRRRGRAGQAGLAQCDRSPIEALVALADADPARRDPHQFGAQALDLEPGPQRHQAFLQVRVEPPRGGHVEAAQQVLNAGQCFLARRCALRGDNDERAVPGQLPKPNRDRAGATRRPARCRSSVASQLLRS